MPSPTTNEKLAILIDADNAQATSIHKLLEEVARYGIASIKRAYGDWTTPHLKGWKNVLHELAIQPVQQFSYTTGKNSTDAALIIDAMDLLHAGGISGFCLVSSDSDFTRLATRIRESGLVVYGFGEKKTPQSFVAACDKFIFMEILEPHAEKVAQAHAPLEPMFRAALNGAVRDNDRAWVDLSAIGNMMLKNNPAFDPRNYGCQKLGELVRQQAFLEVKEEFKNPNSTNYHLYVRLKKAEKNHPPIAAAA